MGKWESELLCLVCLPCVSWLLCGYSSQCHGFVCSLWLWYSRTIFGYHSCEQRWLWWVCTFAWSSLSLHHSSKFSCVDSNGDWMSFCASSEGSDESAHLHRLTLAFVVYVQNLLCCLKWWCVCYSRQQQILWWVCTFARQCNKYQELLCWQQRLLKYIEISSGWNGDFVTFVWTANDVVSLNHEPQDVCATISALYQCFKNAPMRCNKIPQ